MRPKPIVVGGLFPLNEAIGRLADHLCRQRELLAVEQCAFRVECVPEQEPVAIGRHLREAILKAAVERHKVVDSFKGAPAIVPLHRQLQADHFESAGAHEHQAFGKLVAARSGRGLTQSRRAFELHLPRPTRWNQEAYVKISVDIGGYRLTVGSVRYPDALTRVSPEKVPLFACIA